MLLSRIGKMYPIYMIRNRIGNTNILVLISRIFFIGYNVMFDTLGAPLSTPLNVNFVQKHLYQIIFNILEN